VGRNKQSNIGFEATLYEDFRVTFDYYSKNTTDMLMLVNLPDYVGAGDPTGNVAIMTNKGFELELSYHKQIDKLIFDIKANGSYLENEVTDIGDFEFLTNGIVQSTQFPVQRTQPGHAIGSFYGYQVLGIFQNIAEVQHHKGADGKEIQPDAQPGDFQFADLNKDGKITADDRTFIGDPTPTWSYGFTISASYRNFDLLAFGQGVAGNEIYNGFRRLDIPAANMTTEALDRFTVDRPSETYPRLVKGDPNNNFIYPSTFMLTSGAYFRIKAVQIGYNLPKAALNRIGLQQIRVYIGANNLAPFTKYKGFDPEIGGGSFGIDRGIYPQARTFMAGINVTI